MENTCSLPSLLNYSPDLSYSQQIHNHKWYKRVCSWTMCRKSGTGGRKTRLSNKRDSDYSADVQEWEEKEKSILKSLKWSHLPLKRSFQVIKLSWLEKVFFITWFLKVLVLWVTKVFVTCVGLQTQANIFQKLNLERKHQNFWFMEKHLSYNFHIWKKAYHRVFIQFSVRMQLYEIVWQEVSHMWKLYDKKIRSFGQPGRVSDWRLEAM